MAGFLIFGLYFYFNYYFCRGGPGGSEHGLLESTKIQMIRQQMQKAHEEELDRHLRYIKQNLKSTQADPINRSFAYITRDDLLKCFGENRTVLTIRNYKEIHTPGLMLSDSEDKVVLNRALIVTSESQLDVRLVSTTGDSYKKIEDDTKPDDIDNTTEVPKTPARQSKRKQDLSALSAVKKRKPNTPIEKEVSDSENETDQELQASAGIILGEVVDPSKEKFALREFEC